MIKRWLASVGVVLAAVLVVFLIGYSSGSSDNITGHSFLESLLSAGSESDTGYVSFFDRIFRRASSTPPPTPLVPVSVLAVCGDGIRSGSEQCDDGNRNNWDGCSSKCTTEAAVACRDSDGGNIPNLGGYVLINRAGSKSFSGETDSCRDGATLIEKTCASARGVPSVRSNTISCSRIYRGGTCIYDSEGRGYCRNPNLVSAAFRTTATTRLVQELDESFAQTEEIFGVIKTDGDLDDLEGYPVDFAEERLFQRYLIAFLNGDYNSATILHTRIMTGIMGSTQDTVRLLDFALADYYNKLLTDSSLRTMQRAGIRGTLAPAVSVVEQLQWTGVSNIRRQMDRNDIYSMSGSVTGRVVGVDPSGARYSTPSRSGFNDPSLSSSNPFLAAVSEWPDEIGLQCFNYETGTLDRIVQREQLTFRYDDGTERTIRASRYRSTMEGMLNYMIDERLQGKNDCTCMEAAGTDFFCKNDALDGLLEQTCRGGTGSAGSGEVSSGTSFDTSMPPSETPSLEDIGHGDSASGTGGSMPGMCGIGSGLPGGLGANIRAGLCETEMGGETGALMRCISNSRPRTSFPRIGGWSDQIRINPQLCGLGEDSSGEGDTGTDSGTDTDTGCTAGDTRSECVNARNALNQATNSGTTNSRTRDLSRNSGCTGSCDRGAAGSTGATNNAVNRGDVTVQEDNAINIQGACHNTGERTSGCVVRTGVDQYTIHINRDQSPSEYQNTINHELGHIDRDNAGIPCGGRDCPGHHDGTETMSYPTGDSYGGGSLCGAPGDTFGNSCLGGSVSGFTQGPETVSYPDPLGGEGGGCLPSGIETTAPETQGPCTYDHPDCDSEVYTGGEMDARRMINLLGPDCMFMAGMSCNGGSIATFSDAGVSFTLVEIENEGSAPRCGGDGPGLDHGDAGLCQMTTNTEFGSGSFEREDSGGDGFSFESSSR